MSGFSSAESREGSQQPLAGVMSHEDILPSRIITPFSVWNSFACVQMGWLSAEEAMIFLLPESRTMVSRRSSGQVRANFIHTKLWERCQDLLLGILLGQGPKDITKTIGTIEALLLMVEWDSRSLNRGGAERQHREESLACELHLGIQAPTSRPGHERAFEDAEIGIDHPRGRGAQLFPSGDKIAPRHASHDPHIQKERFSRASLLLRIFKHQLAHRLGLTLDVSPFLDCTPPQSLEGTMPAQRLKMVTAWVDISLVERWATEYQMSSDGCSSQGTPTQLVTYAQLALA
ncbi:hypothetical protein BDV24DRAFT_170133 [Aspergillus arachidicola]|uniref:Uncharacterized protein n=1 Tax=Aspergillus arachidicola TaxID=656916 RepID=A0A5N6XMM8_9EURO|nr:hypothetical protein BDV24DRAFT_170133 [Aspergillus arachidicola]